MNRIYSVVKNRDGNMTVASEIAKGAKKGRIVGAIASLSFMLLSNVSYADYIVGNGNNAPNTSTTGADLQKVIVGDNNGYIPQPAKPPATLVYPDSLTVFGSNNTLNKDYYTGEPNSQTVVGSFNELGAMTAGNTVIGQNNNVTCSAGGLVACETASNLTYKGDVGGRNIVIGDTNNVRATTDGFADMLSANPVNGVSNLSNGNNITIGTTNDIYGASNIALGNGVKIGSSSAVTNGIAIGDYSTASADNTVSIGTGSANNRENTVSFGSFRNQRQLTNVAAGTQATDAVNVQQLNSAINQAISATNQANTTAINDQASDINALKQNDIDLQNQIDGLQSNKADKSYVDSQNAAQNSAITANTNKNTQQDTAISNLQATDSSLQNQITANKNTADQQNSTQAQQITDLQNNKADKSALTALETVKYFV